jgi:hypothetical protein
MNDQPELLPFKFGDRVMNVAASERNPIKYGIFVKRINGDFEYTDGRGYFCRTPYDNLVRDPRANSYSLTDLKQRYDDLVIKYHGLLKFYDDHVGTPCEQIRHQYEIEKLTAERDVIIEECAKIADDEDQEIAYAGQHNNWVMRQEALKECAVKIRALKSTPSSDQKDRA